MVKIMVNLGKIIISLLLLISLILTSSRILEAIALLLDVDTRWGYRDYITATSTTTDDTSDKLPFNYKFSPSLGIIIKIITIIIIVIIIIITIRT
jgi:hypothetical protein